MNSITDHLIYKLNSVIERLIYKFFFADETDYCCLVLIMILSVSDAKLFLNQVLKHHTWFL